MNRDGTNRQVGACDIASFLNCYCGSNCAGQLRMERIRIKKGGLVSV